jgi:hypothetical protein
LQKLLGIPGLTFTGNHNPSIIKKRIKKMNKYNSEDYFSVRERRTGRKICDCGDFEDARMIMYMDAPNREIVKNKTLMSPVIDVEMPKALPTNEIVDLGGKWDDPIPEGIDPYNLRGRQPMQPVKKLPQGQGEPVVV